MFNNPLLSEIKFSFPGKDTIIPAHKYVLAVHSSVFFGMFDGDLAETRDTIDIIDCDPDTFLSFLRYIYSRGRDSAYESGGDARRLS